MAEAKHGDTVAIHYTGRLDDGSVFDSSDGRDPLEFEVGAEQVIPGLDCEIPGMTVGEKKSIVIEPAQAYGPVNPDAKQDVPRGDIPENIPLDIGTPLQVEISEGQTISVFVTEVTDDTVVLDANHPLAGKTLKFDVELVNITG